MKLFAMALVQMVTCASSALAAPPVASVMILSSGQSSCGSFVEADAQKQEMYLAYVAGYMTGQNLAALALLV